MPILWHRLLESLESLGTQYLILKNSPRTLKAAIHCKVNRRLFDFYLSKSLTVPFHRILQPRAAATTFQII